MDLFINISKHKDLPARHRTPKLPKTEVKRAIEIAKKRVKALQNKLGERFDLFVCEYFGE